MLNEYSDQSVKEQADLNLCCANTYEGLFSHVSTHLHFNLFMLNGLLYLNSLDWSISCIRDVCFYYYQVF